jgi:hypothetical protein
MTVCLLQTPNGKKLPDEERLSKGIGILLGSGVGLIIFHLSVSSNTSSAM